MMRRLSFEQRNFLKMELYSGANEQRKREIISQLVEDEEHSRFLDYKDELDFDGDF